ncbi:MAG: ComF family protein [Pseudomonadota bacterium]
MMSPILALRDLLYPTTCPLCEARVEEEDALCPTCWAETPFLHGPTCHLCGTGLPGAEGQDADLRCDDCLKLARPWDEGRAALAYSGKARHLVLALKHGDRTELARTGGLWLHRRARDLLSPDTVFVPVPVHRWRLLKRRYNQSALLAKDVATRSGGTFAPLILERVRHTQSQDHRSVRDRFGNLEGAIQATGSVDGQHVALVDDVMTSGATLAACADALRAAGAARITVLILARVAKDP